MVEPNFEEIGENSIGDTIESQKIKYQPLAMTGDDNKAVQLYAKLLTSFGNAKQIDIIVSFLMVLLFFPFLTGKGKAKFTSMKGIVPKLKRVIPYTCI